MGQFWLGLVLGLILLIFCYVAYLGYRSWPHLTSRRRIAVLFLLVPHFLLLVCIALSLSCGHALQGSPCFNRQFVTAVLIMFILPVPTFLGTLLAFALLKGARK